jgi:hypothetical protein
LEKEKTLTPMTADATPIAADNPNRNATVSIKWLARNPATDTLKVLSAAIGVASAVIGIKVFLSSLHVQRALIDI